MKRLFALLFVAIVLTGVFGWPASAPAQNDADQWQPKQAVVMLRNGSVLEGQVLRSGDCYEVQFADGELRIRANEVAFVGPTLEDCYQHRRQGVEFQKVEDHLALVEWCLRHKLLGAAGRELRDAMACDPTHPKIGLLERRLRLALEAPAEAPSSELPHLGVARPEDLDRMIRSMPPGTVETFTNVIQPLLINQCSTSNCHGANSNTSLKLLRVAAGKTQSRRATQRNLHAVLGCINTDDPDESQLLTMPIRPHGTSATATFTSKQAFQYRQLVDWVYSVSNRTNTPPPMFATRSEATWPDETDTTPKPEGSLKLQPLPTGKTARGKSTKLDNKVLPASAVSAEMVQQDATIADAELDNKSVVEPAMFRGDGKQQIRRQYRPGEQPTRSPAKRGVPPDEAKSDDPFDPDEFNRQLGE